MLSYAEHGKFPATTQGRSPRARDEKAFYGTDPARILGHIPQLSVDHGTRNSAMAKSESRLFVDTILDEILDLGDGATAADGLQNASQQIIDNIEEFPQNALAD
jgi:hypothetical protein